jgi:hypothetical protein
MGIAPGIEVHWILITAKKIKNAGVTPVAVLLGLLLIFINNLWITIIEVRWYALDGTCLPIFITPIFILFVTCMVNLIVRKVAPSLALSRGELLTIYIMIVMGATLASHDLIQNLFGTLGHPHYMANESNQYEKLFWRYLPEQWFVTDKVALKGFYAGGVDHPFVWSIIRFWLVPLALWGLLALVMIAMMLCINILIRKQWTENEKLVFPLVQLPIAMTSEDAGRKFYSSKLMWAGFAVAMTIGVINGLHALYPSMPELTGVKQYSIGQFFTARPWNAVNRLRDFNISMYPFMIGLAYFIPLDLSFSCWFFYVARKAWQVVGAAMGWDGAGNSGFPYWDAQSSGAWLALSIVIVVAAMPHLKSVWRQAFSGEGAEEDISEGDIYRKAIYGLALGFVTLLVLGRLMGLQLHFAIIFFVLYFLISIGITRVRAELGTPHEIYFVNPQQIMVGLLGFNVIGIANMTALQSMYWFNRCYRSHPMPNQLESMKMADGTTIKIRPLIFILMLSAAFGLLTSYWANLHVTYSAGATGKSLGFKWWVGAESFDRLTQLIRNKPSTDIVWIIHVILGAVIVTALNLVRGAFVAWPFHPAGYALAISFAMDYFWFTFFVAWLIKLIIVRYGGMKLHNTFVPFFLGLVLGDFVIGSLWAIVGPIINQQAYRIFI